MSERELFQALEKAISSSNNKKILSAADKVLKALPDDPDATKCKVVALLRSEAYDEAINVITGSEHKPHFGYEHAYALFRTQQYEACLKILHETEEDSFRMKELRAQALYRLERFDEAIELYQDLIEEKPCMERQTNLVACHAAATVADPEKVAPAEVLQTEDDAFEHTYNRTLLATAQHRLPTAASLIQKSQEQCVEMLKEDDPEITQEEINQELALLKAQEGVVHHLQGDEERAKKIYLNIIRFNQDNPTVLAVASNNMVAINKDRDVFNSKHRMRATRTEGLERKLSSAQKMIIAFNQCLLLLHSNAIAKCRDQCQQLREQYPDSTVPSLIEAYTYLKERKVKNKAERLQALCDQHPDDEILALVLAHEYARHGDFPNALSALQRVATLAYKPAYVGYVLALCRRLQRPDVASQQLEKAINHWKKKAQEDEESARIATSLQQMRGDLLLQQRKYEDAVTVFQDLIDEDLEDLRSVASLIVALAQVDIEKAEQVSEAMPPLVLDEEEPLDVDALEEARKLRVAKTARRARGGALDKLAEALADKAAKETRPKRRRKKKGKLPKNAVPGEEPDPDRWLPKWQRKGNKGRRKGKKKSAAVKHGTQGSASVTKEEMDKLDASKLPDAPKGKGKAQKPKPKGQRRKKGGRRR